MSAPIPSTLSPGTSAVPMCQIRGDCRCCNKEVWFHDYADEEQKSVEFVWTGDDD